MKVFISWSGDTSKAAAIAIGQSVSDVFSSVEPWISAVNIQAGQQWFSELMQALEDSKFAIACITKRSLGAPWIMFESGALSAKFGSPRLVPLMLDCVAEDLVDPLARFNGVLFDEDSVHGLFKSINSSVGTPLTPKALKAAFKEIWPDLNAKIHDALEAERKTLRPEYDVFLSAPMASFKDDSEYQSFRAEVLKVIHALDACGLSVFCALETIESMSMFDTHGVSTHDDLDIMKKSGSFIMLYPQRLATSALFEAGYALALGLPSLFFVRDEQDLPYLMQRLPEAVTHVSILDSREWQTYEDIGDLLRRNAHHYFRTGSVAQLKL
ncbi:MULTISPECIES: toll/interleukin-1 receptor domain-containing protein [Methylomonas]|uniref:toll/interleukin-1 receptor domain-containing protein n=1 Tax=Methylomonas TaxID=416 RepID=UPI001232329C|nr:toll/interleukin-1 receptor domain-containing protein [Methylomonas rhizoryzae]